VWTGWIHHRDIIPYYHDADVFVMTSDHEAQNVAMLEAMGCGLPVVATAVGLAPEIMARHGNGVCVPVRDAEKLADALAEFMDDPTRRRDAGMSSRQAIEACDHERLVPALIEVYRRLGSAN
jgi:glycosyltransferase involved in cell wall biosynthesis